MTAPIVLTGETSSGNRFVQFWNDRAKIAGQTVTEMVVSMNSSIEFGRERFRIGPGCPDVWVDAAVAAFDEFRAGRIVRATHTVVWEFGNPVFTSVDADSGVDQ